MIGRAKRPRLPWYAVAYLFMLRVALAAIPQAMVASAFLAWAVVACRMGDIPWAFVAAFGAACFAGTATAAALACRKMGLDGWGRMK